MVKFDTGSLNAEELEAILNSIPIDVSFVDKDDVVRYFNKPEGRIFPRTKAVLGLNVRNCHPKKSLAKVERILRDFKGGKKDSAEFWINMKGRMIHIRYFAVRGERGGYLGCLEVTQDITEIQKLKGEKRLLD